MPAACLNCVVTHSLRWHYPGQVRGSPRNVEASQPGLPKLPQQLAYRIMLCAQNSLRSPVSQRIAVLHQGERGSASSRLVIHALQV